MASWSDQDIEAAKAVLRRYPVDRFREAVAEIAEMLGRPINGGSLRHAFARRMAGAPTDYCMRPSAQTPPAAPAPRPQPVVAPVSAAPPAPRTNAPPAQPSPAVQRLVQVTRREPLDFATLCDRLDLSPAKTRALVDEARQAGVVVHVENNHVGIRASGPEERVRTVGIAPVVGQRQKVGVISDTHLGSKYCLREQLREFVEYAYAQGVREILHPGDVLDGMYRHGVYEVSHVGLDEQARDLFETLPRLPGLTYHAITGNHDATFTDASGVDVGQYLTAYFQRHGRNDLSFYGNRGAFLRIRGAVVHLWHPRSGVSYARSYALQKLIEKYSSGEKPNILLAGHWHVQASVFERGVHGIACPTFQGGGSAFSKSLGGAPAIGGMILSWDLTAHGTMRSFIHEYRSYYEVEKPQRIANDTAYLEEMEETPIPAAAGGHWR
jgi:predicted phosphodiesterase